jgi:hypothetical protein
LPDRVPRSPRRKARAAAAESALAQARAVASTSEATIEHLRLEIARLRRERYGHGSERRARLIDQMEWQLEDLEAAATEDERAAETAARTAPVAGFRRRRPARKPFPEHLPRARVVIAAPTTCSRCGPDRIVKIGEDVTGTLEVGPGLRPFTPRIFHWKVRRAAREPVFTPGSGRWSRRCAGSSPAAIARRSASRRRRFIPRPAAGPGRTCGRSPSVSNAWRPMAHSCPRSSVSIGP